MGGYRALGALKPSLKRTLVQAALFTAALGPAPAHAIEMAYSHRGLVTDSEVIVIATLRGTSGYMKNGCFIDEGILDVDRVVCGSVAPGDSLLVRWQNYPGVAGRGVSHYPNIGKSRLWFLKGDVEGVLRADTEQRVWPVDELETFLDTLAAYPYYVRTPEYAIGERVVITIEFRNATTSTLSVPTIRVANGRVVYGQGFNLVLKTGYSMGIETPVVFRPDVLTRDAHLAHTNLAPGETRRVDLPLSGLLTEMPPGLYRFNVHVDGHVTGHGVRVQTSWETGLDRVRGTPGEIPYYIQTLRDGDPESGSALMMLSLARKETARFADELMSLSDSLRTSMRLEIMRLIGRLDTPIEELVDFYLARIDDRVVGAGAVFGASQMLDGGNPYRRDEIVNALLALLDDEDLATRLGAIGTVSNCRITAALPALRIIARYDPDEEARRDAWWAIDVLEGRMPCKDRPVVH